MDRKDFLRKMSLGLVAAPIALTSCMTPWYLRDSEDCKLTGQDALGPFWVKGTSEVLNLNTKGSPGRPLLITGTVYSGEGRTTPVAGAKIDLWHADDAGAYHPNGGGKIDQYPAESINLRGFVLTDEDGRFAFRSIFPGYYGSRARHIHYKINAKGHKELITQNYFEGDDRIPHDVQAKDAGACRIIPLLSHSDATLNGVMDFNLKPR